MASNKSQQLPYPIIDCHHHLWDLSDPHRSESGHFDGSRDYVAKHLQRDVDTARVKLAGTVYLQCGWKGDLWGETEWCQKVANETNNTICTAIVGECDLLQPYDVVERELKEHMRFPNFRGIRFLIANDPQGRPHTQRYLDPKKQPNAYEDPVLQKNLELFGKLGLSYDLWCYSHQLKGATALVRMHPNVNFVMDHMGTPIEIGKNRETEYAKWLADFTELSKCPNVCAKVSGLMAVLGLECGRKQSAEWIAKSVFGDMVRDTVRLFGPERCMFGSNFPVDKAEAFLETLIEAYLIIFRGMGLSEADIEQIFRKTASRFYRIGEYAPKGGKL
ncbi:hypothetical protein DFJ74DRAFT_685747 [Hyaloraphidium curvatum]|nr:hypothetical protein DFJ74DRAFT_685747 [Hyaloraphidium curvatum]